MQTIHSQLYVLELGTLAGERLDARLKEKGKRDTPEHYVTEIKYKVLAPFRHIGLLHSQRKLLYLNIPS